MEVVITTVLDKIHFNWHSILYDDIIQFVELFGSVVIVVRLGVTKRYAKDTKVLCLCKIIISAHSWTATTERTILRVLDMYSTSTNLSY